MEGILKRLGEIMRFDEDFARERFDNYLRDRTSWTISWKDGNQSAPPDFYLTIGNDDFIVEVTSIVELVDSEKPISKINSDESARCFVQEVEKEAQARSILIGQYFVGFSRFRLLTRKMKSKLKEKLLAFVEKTQSQSFIPLTPISENNLSYLSICKSSDQGAKITIANYPIITEWLVVAREKAWKLLEEAVAKKCQKLDLFTDPKILLLLHQYEAIEPEAYRDFIDQVEDKSAFLVIFVVYPPDENRDYVLYTQNFI